jgi:hypothetical protein
MTDDFFGDLAEGVGEVASELAEGDLEGAGEAAVETLDEAGQNLAAAGEEAGEEAGEVVAETASEFVSFATGGTVDVAVGGGTASVSFDLGDEETGVHLGTEVDLDFSDGSGGVRAEAGGAVLGADASTSAFAGVRTVGEGDDTQTGFDTGIGIGFLGNEAEAGATVNVDTDRSGDDSSQTGIDIGVFGSAGGVRVETGGTVNIDEERDADGGLQQSIDSGFFVEADGHRVETGVTIARDRDVDADGSVEGRGEAGVFLEFDGHRTEATVGVVAEPEEDGPFRAGIAVGIEADEQRAQVGVGIRAESDEDGTAHIGLVVGAEANEHRAEIGVAATVEPTFTDLGGGKSTGGADFGIEVFAEADGERAEVQAEVGVELTNSLFRERDGLDTIGGVLLGGGLHAGISASAGDEEVGLDVNLETGAGEFFEQDDPGQADLLAVEVEGRAGDHRASLQASVNLDGRRGEDGSTEDVRIDLGLAATADDHLAEASVFAGISGLDGDEPTFDVGVAAEADDDRVEAGVFVRTEATPNEVRFVDPITSVGVFASANDERVEASTEDIGDALTEESSTLASAPAAEAVATAPLPSPIARRVQVVDALDNDADAPTTAVDAGPAARVPRRVVGADDGPTPVPSAPRPPGTRLIEPSAEAGDDDAPELPTTEVRPAARVPRRTAIAEADVPSGEASIEASIEASSPAEPPNRPGRTERAVNKRVAPDAPSPTRRSR